MNFHSGRRTTPAIDVATDAKPGMNLATASERAPQRAKIDSVCRTQESGDSEMRQMVFSTPLPKRRPGAVPREVGDQRRDAPRRAISAGSDAPPCAASAPVMISVGIRRHRQSRLQHEHIDEHERAGRIAG